MLFKTFVKLCHHFGILPYIICAEEADFIYKQITKLPKSVEPIKQNEFGYEAFKEAFIKIAEHGYNEIVNGTTKPKKIMGLPNIESVEANSVESLLIKMGISPEDKKYSLQP